MGEIRMTGEVRTDYDCETIGLPAQRWAEAVFKIAEEEIILEISVEKDVILNIGEQLERLVTFPPSEEGQPSWENDTDNEMAVIADVHTDPNSGQVLEVGVGYPLALYVIVPGSQGPVLAFGGMFSYYEFKHPMSDRLTDEAWQDMLHAGEEPDTPEWADDFLSFEGTETITEHLGNPVQNSTISGLLLETETQVVNTGDILEVWITTNITEGLEVRFWMDDQLLEQSSLDPDPENEGIVSTSVSTGDWPAGVVRAEMIYQGESLRNTYLEIVSPVYSPADLDSDGQVAEKYRISGIPTTFFIDKEGIIQIMKIGAYASQADLEADLSSLTGD